MCLPLEYAVCHVRAKDIQTDMLHSLQDTLESCFKNTFNFELCKSAIVTFFFLIYRRER